MRNPILLIFMAMVAMACNDPGQAPANDYIRGIVSARIEKHFNFKNAAVSPLKSEDIPSFSGLHYFEVDPLYRVEGQLTLTPSAPPFEMPATGEKKDMYRQYGVVEFKVGDHSGRLNVYENLRLLNDDSSQHYLILPFRDATTGEQTYGGGRYLDLNAPDDGEIIIDFNLAYNPYCAYNEAYSCIVPPAENVLDFPIRAGEKNYHH